MAHALAELNVRCAQLGVDLYRFLGSVYRIAVSRAVGVNGVIPGIANVVPEIAVRAWEAGEAGDTETVQECEAKLLIATTLQNVARGGSTNSRNLASMKSALKILGVLDHDAMSRPMKALSEEETKAIPPILRELGLLN